ncbi:MAG: adenosylcobalamin-dependent ribonucleoside-diphosphate reductase [Thaumarchaeota archaeon]|nr:adenosylcobalamin-dependent ribonucleoside-diphosphate reductase [Nitrososphaerota archaeon]MCY3975807.1 adenosylcobalamin-dependent ribonucleoside-diphosphate reductase [Nitrososphaerota archaeon]
MKKSQLSNSIMQVRKRNGKITNFNKNKISNAIYKALVATSKADRALANELTNGVINKLHQQGFSNLKSPSVEDVQDMVESILIDQGYSDIAKAYILYRHERRKIREEKMSLLNSTSLDPVAKNFDINCLRVLASRYLIRNKNSEIIENPTEMFERTAILVAIGDLLYDPALFSKDNNVKQDVEKARTYLTKLDDFDCKFKLGDYFINKWHFRSLINHYIYLATNGHMKLSFKDLLIMLASKKLDKYTDKVFEYLEIMASQDFLPNSPTLMNSGRRLGQLSACFVLDMKDDMAQIMKSTSDAALIFKSGGGVGINYSELRQEGDIVASTSGVASGPVSFMNIINTVTEVVKQGGKRRGANMGIIESWHPDIEKFITVKTKPGMLENFNLSVGIWEDFWKVLIDSDAHKYTLRNTHDKKPVRDIDAHHLIDLIALSAWKSAEPGLIFFDIINKHNVFAKARGKPLRATNPCGEQSLYPYESCNLGSINLSNIVKRKADGEYEFDWQRYEEIIRKTTVFLDNIIDMNYYPINEIAKASRESRRIGLGVMGVADLLYKLCIPYNSQESYEFQSKLAEALTYYSMDESISLAISRGSFELYSRTEYPEGKIPVAGYYEKPKSEHYYDWDSLISKIKKYGIRNVLTTTVAPTGTLSMIADCSNGIEPIFALVFEKRVTVGRFFYTNKIFEQTLKKAGIYSEELLSQIADNYGTLNGIDKIPDTIKKIFVTAMDVHWTDHLMAQAVWQDWIGNAIAKTINMPNDASVEDVKSSYLLAHEVGLKGITVYRDGSRKQQVLHLSKNTKKNFQTAPSDYTINYIVNDIKNHYVKTQICNTLHLPTDQLEKESSVENHISHTNQKCPSCKNDLVFIEGCSMCINCGYSGCNS